MQTSVHSAFPAARIAAAMAASPEGQRVWSKFYHSQREENPGHGIANSLRALPQNPAQMTPQRTELVLFARELLLIER